MRSIPRSVWPIVPLWAVSVAVAITSRPILPIDETRYVAVAWEMWNRGDYLVPHLNGAVYSHKPPLLFWLINAGWSIFGVHAWVARLVGPGFALLDFLAVGYLARKLWRDDEAASFRAGAMLLAMPLVAVYGALLMFDAMLTFFVLLALMGLSEAPQGRWRASALIALGIGGGILAKGPVTLVYLAPVLASAPWWSPDVRAGWKRFAARVAVGFVAGIAIALAWALPAAIFGGAEYREAILWKQTAGRMTQSFAHQEPLWFYLPLVPVALFPWLFWRPVFASFRRNAPRDSGLRFCAAWLVGSFVLISLISGKQVHYLLPIVPAGALIAARASSREEGLPRPPIAILAYAVLGVVLIAVSVFALQYSEPVLLPKANPFSIGLLAVTLVGAIWLLVYPRTSEFGVWPLAALCVGFVVSAQWMMGPSLYTFYDPAPIAREISNLQAKQTPLAHRSEYHGQYHFAGRLTQPILSIENEPALVEWCKGHPDGVVIKYWRGADDPYAGQTLFKSYFRGGHVGLVRATAFIPAEQN